MRAPVHSFPQKIGPSVTLWTGFNNTSSQGHLCFSLAQRRSKRRPAGYFRHCIRNSNCLSARPNTPINNGSRSRSGAVPHLRRCGPAPLVKPHGAPSASGDTTARGCSGPGGPWRKPTLSWTTSSSKRLCASTRVSSSSPRRRAVLAACSCALLSRSFDASAEFHHSRGARGQRLVPHQQVLRRLPRRAILRRQRDH